MSGTVGPTAQAGGASSSASGRARLTRRGLLGGLAGLPVLSAAGLPSLALAAVAPAPAAAPAPVPTLPAAANLLVGGPRGGVTDRWAIALASGLARGLPPGTGLRLTSVGGVDGVTAANQFDARTDPDGGTLLVVPGDAALAWLAGDPRAQFDAAHWVPVMAAAGSAVLVGRMGLDALFRRPTLRLACSSATGPATAVLLALDLLGLPVRPQFGLVDAAAKRGAYAAGDADFVLLHGPDVPRQVAAYVALGAQPVFSLGATDIDGAPVRDPLFPDLPTVVELHARLRGAAPSGPLYQAWRATVAATELTFGLMLPPLTPASLVAVWRRAGDEAVMAPAMVAETTAHALRPLPPTAAAAATRLLAASPASLLELRSWLATRWNYRPT